MGFWLVERMRSAKRVAALLTKVTLRSNGQALFSAGFLVSTPPPSSPFFARRVHYNRSKREKGVPP